MKLIILLALLAPAALANLIATPTGDPCIHYNGPFQSGATLQGNTLKIVAYSDYGDASLQEYSSCGFTISGSIFTDGPLRPGLIEIITGGSVEGILTIASASFSMPGVVNVTCQQSCGLPNPLRPIQLGTGYYLTATATADIFRNEYGGGGLITAQIRMLELDYREVPILFADPNSEDPGGAQVPEPSTFAIAAGSLGLLAWRRRAGAKP